MRMTRRRALLIAGGLLFCGARAVRAEHFDIKLVAAGPDGVTQQAFADQAPPPAGLNPRPVLKARAGDRITVQFIMTNVYPHGTAKGAGVHYYVVPESRLGQNTVPALNSGVVTEAPLPSTSSRRRASAPGKTS